MSPDTEGVRPSEKQPTSAFGHAQSPIFVTADEPLLVFRSAEDAQRWLEWPDVEDGLYRGYDSDGRLIEFGVRKARTKRRFLPGFRLDREVVLTVERDPTHTDELRAALVFALRLQPPEAARVSLDELKQGAVRRFGFLG
jgi:hypothetical protein